MKDDDLFINQSTVLQPDITPRIYEWDNFFCLQDAVISPSGTGKGNYLIPLLSISGNVSLDREGWF